MTTLKAKIASNRLTVGSWIQLGDPSLVEMMAAGPFDWLAIDLEHTAISISQAAAAIRIGDLAGCPMLVRLSGHDPSQIKRVLDAGATGIIAPMVATAQEASAIVAAATYPPAGTRGVGLARAQAYGLGFQEYAQRISEELIVICQVEHVDGVRNLEAILSVEGVDGFFIGPYDLSASLGHPGVFDHPEMLSAMEEVAVFAADPGFLAGIHVVEPDVKKLANAVADGYRFVALASDMLMFSHQLAAIGAEVDGLRSEA